MHRNAGMSESDYAAFLKRAEGNRILAYEGTPEDVANSIAFLASDAAAFTTGETIFVDGGWSRTTPR